MSAREKQVGGRHYRDAAVQPWDVIDTWPLEQRIGFYRGNQLKYIMRAGTKSGVQSLEEIEKANHYGEKLAEVLREQSEPRGKITVEVTKNTYRDPYDNYVGPTPTDRI